VNSEARYEVLYTNPLNPHDENALRRRTKSDDIKRYLRSVYEAYQQGQAVISRNEFDNALGFGASYSLHIAKLLVHDEYLERMRLEGSGGDPANMPYLYLRITPRGITYCENLLE
jgi:hypothetical protein